MKAFTVYQPYAFAIVSGLKHYETRKKRTSIRGRVAVHAAKGTPRFVTMALDMALPEHMTLHYGAVIGTVEIVDCVQVEEIRDSLTERERALGDYSPGRFAWVLQNPELFEHPIPARGNQGWWNWVGEYCRECWCVACDLFQTKEYLEGEDLCARCGNKDRTTYCRGIQVKNRP